MHTREAPDFWRLHKNMNCAFPLSISVVLFVLVKYENVKMKCANVLKFDS